MISHSIIKQVSLGFLALAVLTLAGCSRGRTTDKPPVHLNPNMDTQQKYKPFRSSTFFADGSTMRTPLPGTVAQGELRDDLALYTGKNEDGTYASTNPLPVTKDFLNRGQERFNIYCAPCHSQVGDGKGIIVDYKYPIPPTSVHEERIRQAEDGYLFEIISKGVRNMPAYDHQIPVNDRWAIVSYVRALQRSQHASIGDIPSELKSTVK